MPSPSPDPDASPTEARLTVVVPHWSATVALIDNALMPVTGIDRVASGPDGTGFVAASLPPGAYEVQVTLDGRTQARWIVLQPGETTAIPAAAWDALGIVTAMPLAQPQPTGGADDRLAGEAARASTAAALPIARGGDAPGARLSIFATAIVPDRGRPRRFDLAVQLLAEDGTRIADLTTTAPTVDPAGLWWRCAFDLDPGYYVLRARDGAGWRIHPLYLCAGMESHAFVRCDGPPLLDTLTIDMGRLGEGYDPKGDRAIASDALLTALRAPGADRAIVGCARMTRSVLGEGRDAWLGVLAAYALLGGEGAEAAAMARELRLMLHDGPLRDHPDVVALLIDERASDTPLRHPPMLRAALQRLNAWAVDRADAIAPGSPLDRLGDRLIADSPWTAWGEAPAVAIAPPAAPARPVRRAGRWLRGIVRDRLAALARRPSDPVAAAQADLLSLPDPVGALVRAFPANAPVWPLADHAALTGAEAVADGATIAVHAALIEAAIAGLPTADHPAPAEVRVAMQDGSPDLLDVSAQAVSRLSGIALDRVLRNFRRLKEAGPGEAASAIAGDVRSALSTLIAAIDARRSGADDAAPTAIATPIEDVVARMQAEADRLRALPVAAAIAARLDAAAARLLAHAHLIVIADATGKLRYGNRLLRDRIVARGSEGRAALDRLRDRLAAQTEPQTIIAAADLSPASPEAQAGLTIAVQRTTVRGTDDSAQGHIHYLRNTAIRGLDSRADRRLDAAVSQLTLQASLLEYGWGDDAARALRTLDALSVEIAAILA